MSETEKCCTGHAAVCEDWHKQLRRIEALEAALEDILDVCWLPDQATNIARAALAPEQDK